MDPSFKQFYVPPFEVKDTIKQKKDGGVANGDRLGRKRTSAWYGPDYRVRCLRKGDTEQLRMNQMKEQHAQRPDHFTSTDHDNKA